MPEMRNNQRGGLLMRRYLDGRSMDGVAIERLRTFEPEALAKHENGYWLAFSGGKDSCVILDLAKRSGVKFEAHHNLTTVDPPELVRFVKTFPEVQIDKPKESMWQLIRRKGFPPLRNIRYCCEALKECGGSGRMVITGVRWGESNRRSKRQMTEACYRDKSGKHYIHPIIDWTTSEVWEYIRGQELPYCSLYDEGFKRVGCVLCPMSRETTRDIQRWPKLCAAWKRAIDSTDTDWQSWLNRKGPISKAKLDDDPVLFEDDPSVEAY